MKNVLILILLFLLIFCVADGIYQAREICRYKRSIREAILIMNTAKEKYAVGDTGILIGKNLRYYHPVIHGRNGPWYFNEGLEMVEFIDKYSKDTLTEK